MIVNEVKKEINEEIKKEMTENQVATEELRIANQELENDILAFKRQRFAEVGKSYLLSSVTF